MKTALLVGCGSKFGKRLLNSLVTNNWEVYSISGSAIDNNNVNQCIINWQTVNVANIEKFLKNIPPVDLIMFNQNSSALANQNFTQNSYATLELWKQEKHWNQCYFVSCILPFHIIHTLGNRCSASTNVAWMLSSYIYKHKNISHADYIGNKYQNYLIMKNFSQAHPANFFGINPDTITDSSDSDQLTKVLTNGSCDLNGKVVKFDGTEDVNFNMFIQ